MEENKKLGQDPAFPTKVDHENGRMKKSYQIGETVGIYPGISKRFYAACIAMTGILSNSNLTNNNDFDIPNAVRSSYQIADELLKQENQ